MMKQNGVYVTKYKYFQEIVQKISQFCDIKATKQNKEGWIITPETTYNTNIIYKFFEFKTPIDSSNLIPSDLVKIASKIEENYDNFDSFIIIHGTDTMSYSASALSFMLENLGKTVILTGSQIPPGEIRNDAFDNLMGSLIIAGHFVIPEVCIFFRDRLLRGNRSKKIDSMSLQAFGSPNFPNLGNSGVNLTFRKDLLLPKPKPHERFSVFKNMDTQIATVKM